MDITDIKAENIKKILDILRFSSGLTKRDLAAMTGLSFSTVSNLCNELKDNQVLCEEKSNDYSVGRTPNQLVFRCEQYCSICADLQQENLMNFTVLDFSNRCLFHTSFDISGCSHVQQIVTIIADTYRSLLESGEFQNVQFIGIGVSVPGIYDRATGNVINAASMILNDTPLKTLLSQQLRLPCYVYVDNESNLCALSMRQTHLQNENIVYLHSSAGLGLGVICEGRLLRGSNGFAAEVSHIPLGDPSIRCPFCGSYGCIENDLSQRGMDILSFPGLSAEERARLVEDRGKKLGELLAILVNLFDPAVLYVGGSAMDSYDEMAPHALAVLNRRCSMAISHGLQVLHDADSLRTIGQGINQVIYEKWNPLEKKY